ncbi:MAG TPA: hypothetical protein VHE81_22320, partial [Lacipirellulaceae bacterium]|nr:hypothetical protein [Lacipirellulaceae bacterium]
MSAVPSRRDQLNFPGTGRALVFQDVRATSDFCARLHMIRWQILAAVALVCSTGGCQLKQLRRANEDLERENFQLEQRLDELTWQLEDAKAALQTCQNSLCATGTGSSSSPRSSSDAGPTS